MFIRLLSRSATLLPPFLDILPRYVSIFPFLLERDPRKFGVVAMAAKLTSSASPYPFPFIIHRFIQRACVPTFHSFSCLSSSCVNPPRVSYSPPFCTRTLSRSGAFPRRHLHPDTLTFQSLPRRHLHPDTLTFRSLPPPPFVLRKFGYNGERKHSHTLTLIQ